jgi:hypothetical protein
VLVERARRNPRLGDGPPAGEPHADGTRTDPTRPSFAPVRSCSANDARGPSLDFEPENGHSLASRRDKYRWGREHSRPHHEFPTGRCASVVFCLQGAPRAF